MEQPRAGGRAITIEIMHAMSRIAALTGSSIAARFWILKLARRDHLCSGG
jgi:hypothetical protein